MQIGTRMGQEKLATLAHFLGTAMHGNDPKGAQGCAPGWYRRDRSGSALMEANKREMNWLESRKPAF